MTCLQEVFPDASVEAEGNGSSSVTILDAKTKTKIVSVSQRDLYRKYKWPAAGTITNHLQIYKETMEE